MNTLTVSCVDHQELVLLHKLLPSSTLQLLEDLVDRHEQVYTADGRHISAMQAAIIICQHATNADQLSLSHSLSWIELAYSVIKPALHRAADPHSTAFSPLQAALHSQSFLVAGVAKPSAADWLIWAMLHSRISTMTASLAKERFWRVVRWGEYLRVEACRVVGSAVCKPFDMSSLTAGIDAIAVVKKGKQSETKKDQKTVNEITKPIPALDMASRIDVRVGKIVNVIKHPNADRLYIEQVDLGEPEPRTVVSGLVEHLTIDQLQDRLCCFLCNLKPAAICKTTSQAMILVGKTDTELHLLSPPEGSKPGDLVSIEGFERQPDAQLRQKDNVWPTVQSLLRIENGVVVYGESKGKLVTELGNVTVPLTTGIIS